MSDYAHRHSQPINDELHPRIYKTLVGLAIWFVLSAWLLFDRGTAAYVGLMFAMITVFFVIIVSIPALIWLTWRRNVGNAPGGSEPFRFWTTREFKTGTGAVSGGEATMQILLPIAAVSVGITIFGLVFIFAVPQLGY
jgi:hypothetical protein